MDALRGFLAGYWAHAQWYLLGVGVLSVVTMVLLRRPGKAFAILLLGVYITMTLYFLSVHEGMGFSLETALGTVVVGGLALMALLYYFLFIRSE